LNADPDPDPATQINADPCGSGSGYGSGSETLFKTPTKNYFFKCFSAYYFLKVHLHHFSKIKSHKDVTKQ
jgi:hypothetical protein